MNEQELLAARTDELTEGEMKEIISGEIKIILAKVGNEYYAVDGICPHYKAPLIKGALCGTKLYCPWHHSVFDIRNGVLCEPPALHGLKHYDVIKKEDAIYIRLPEKKKNITTYCKATQTGKRL